MTKDESALSRAINGFEEGAISLLFAGMTLVTFVQVVLRYVFNSGFVWALELTVYLFAWLVLFGASYGIKRSAHLGVDAFVKIFPEKTQRGFALLAVLAALVYAVIMLVGSWDYVSKLYTIGIESEDLPIPQWVPMAILPIGMLLLILRLLQAGLRIFRGEQESLLADEAREAIEELVAEVESGDGKGHRP